MTSIEQPITDHRSPFTVYSPLTSDYRSLLTVFNGHPKDSYLLEFKDIDKRKSDRLQGLFEVLAPESVFLGMEENMFGEDVLVEAGVKFFDAIESA